MDAAWWPPPFHRGQEKVNLYMCDLQHCFSVDTEMTRKWKKLFVNGCKNKSLSSTENYFLNALQDGTQASKKIITRWNDEDKFNGVTTCHLSFMT